MEQIVKGCIVFRQENGTKLAKILILIASRRDNSA
jgi:hypothetical protein